MSASGPDSIPTSADPKSHRPTKRRALTPVSAQAASVDALFAKPDQDIRVPGLDGSAVGRLRSAAAPPEIVTNVQGSSAGAGSGEFHVYKASRRREYERLKEMDSEVRRGEGQVQFEKDRAERVRKDEERTRKNREKRDKLKARKANKGKNGAAGGKPKPPTIAQKAGDASQGGDKTEEKGDSRAAEKNDDEPSKPSTEPVGLVIHDDD